MKKGDYVRTPRFCNVRIERVFRSEANSRKMGFTESTDYDGWEYGILGKITGTNHMIFAAYKR